MAQIERLSEDLQKVAIEQLNEVPSRIPEDLLSLKQWIEQQPHLRARTDDQFLIQFLRGCKYSLEKTKGKLDLFFSLKSKYPNFFNVTDVDSPKFREVHNMGGFYITPKPLHENGPRLVVFQFTYDTSKYNLDDVFLTYTAVHEIMMYTDPYACINGLVYIIDYGGATANHYLQITIIRQLKDLADHIPYAYLPADYGGQNSSSAEAVKEYHKTWDLYRDYLKDNANYGTDESLRPGKPLDLDGLFGVGGSFRKLNVD